MGFRGAPGFDGETGFAGGRRFDGGNVGRATSFVGSMRFTRHGGPCSISVAEPRRIASTDVPPTWVGLKPMPGDTACGAFADAGTATTAAGRPSVNGVERIEGRGGVAGTLGGFIPVVQSRAAPTNDAAAATAIARLRTNLTPPIVPEGEDGARRGAHAVSAPPGFV